MEGTEEEKAAAEEEADDEGEEGSSKSRIENSTSGFLCLVLDYCPRGSLFDCIIKRKEKVHVPLTPPLFVVSHNFLLFC